MSIIINPQTLSVDKPYQFGEETALSMMLMTSQKIGTKEILV
jgi:hypothetical protein